MSKSKIISFNQKLKLFKKETPKNIIKINKFFLKKKFTAKKKTIFFKKHFFKSFLSN